MPSWRKMGDKEQRTISHAECGSYMYVMTASGNSKFGLTGSKGRIEHIDVDRYLDGGISAPVDARLLSRTYVDFRIPHSLF